jgi:hypothetical protein
MYLAGGLEACSTPWQGAQGIRGIDVWECRLMLAIGRSWGYEGRSEYSAQHWASGTHVAV